MGFFNGVRKVIKPHVNVTSWVDFSSVKNSAASIFGYVKKLFVPEQATRTETFQQARARLELSEKDLKSRLKEFYILAWAYFALAVAVFSYAVYLLVFAGAFISAWISFVISMLVLAHAFRKRFWYFQVKTNHLGYTFKEWFRADLLGKQHEK